MHRVAMTADAHRLLLPLSKVYSLLIQDERVKSVIKDREIASDSVAFAAHRFPSNSTGASAPGLQPSTGPPVDRRTLTCTHCG